jgi:predicted CDP-diglyceride synthetase/phosphatidate cytidylyltransferase
VKYKRTPKCTGSTTLGGLIGGGIAASLSKSDAYSWSIPLGAVLGAGIANAECK